ncbi:MAG: cytochrome c [Gammaproteobacteria bacterium]|nr:cytochrome c [Gammaproteobacteria bacterium]MYF66559.1 cytochrome c [Gammaproteobacteria bacterium]MYK37129.1 cytochrome c [Gammaproteobacteria bacterium]
MSARSRIPRPRGLAVPVLVLWTLGSALAWSDEPGGDVQQGLALYISQQCWQCHGYEGQGGVAGVRLAPTLLPFEAFARLVRFTNLMPAYSPKVLSDEQLRLIYAYVRSIPEPPPLEEIPELDFD